MQLINGTWPPGWCAINHLYLVGWASVGSASGRLIAVGRWWADLHYCLGVRVYVCMILLFFFKRSFMYIHWYYCVLHSIPLMSFTESLYVVLSSRIYFEFYVYLWDIRRCVACWFYVFLCTLSEMTNKTCTIINHIKRRLDSTTIMLFCGMGSHFWQQPRTVWFNFLHSCTKRIICWLMCHPLATQIITIKSQERSFCSLKSQNAFL